MATAESLREEAARSRRLAGECTDKVLQRELLAHALELDDRAARMMAAIAHNLAAFKRPAGDKG